jgi:hypothetical protein
LALPRGGRARVAGPAAEQSLLKFLTRNVEYQLRGRGREPAERSPPFAADTREAVCSSVAGPGSHAGGKT